MKSVIFCDIGSVIKSEGITAVAASLAHEIRNPLATADAAIQLFNLVHEESKRTELLSKIKQEIGRDGAHGRRRDR